MVILQYAPLKGLTLLQSGEAAKIAVDLRKTLGGSSLVRFHFKVNGESHHSSMHREPTYFRCG